MDGVALFSGHAGNKDKMLNNSEFLLLPRSNTDNMEKNM